MNINFIKQLVVAALMIAAIVCTGCGGGATISMTGKMSGEITIVLAGTGEAIIDWSDGSTPEMVELSALGKGRPFERYHVYTHTFAGTNIRTVTINGQNITHLSCTALQLTALDVSNATALTELDCGMNQLTRLDVSNNTALTGLRCHNNQLTSLDVTKNTALIALWCVENQLTSLDVSNNTVLTELHCNGNQLTAGELNALFDMLPVNTNCQMWISENPGASGCDHATTTEKGWNVYR